MKYYIKNIAKFGNKLVQLCRILISKNAGKSDLQYVLNS